MNEIITKLDEIEGKADAIISDARSRKEQMAAQLAIDKKGIDDKYDALEHENAAHLEHELRNKADTHMAARRQESEQALEQLEREFKEKKEVRSEEIFQRIIQV